MADVKMKKKHKKKLKKVDNDEEENAGTLKQADLDQQSNVDNTQPRKKKKKDKLNDSVKDKSQAMNDNVPIVAKTKKSKKDKKKTKSAEKVAIQSDCIIVINTNIQTTKKSKKDKKKESTATSEERESIASIAIDKQKTKKSKKDKKEKEPSVDSEESKKDADSIKAKKLKRKKSEKKMTEAENESKVVSKKKKKKKKDSKEESDLVTGDNTEKVTNELEMTCDSDLKVKKKRSQDEMINEDVSSSKKIKVEADENGKTDGEIESNSSSFGQWGQVSLGSEDRTNKFLKLMGGLRNKPESTSDSKAVSDNSVKTPNKFVNPKSPFLASNRKAMTEGEQEALNKKLEDQFQKAFDLKLNTEKGSGLGYAPPPGAGKKFHIDVNSSKSVKFD